jgi:hypothetical protein
MDEMSADSGKGGHAGDRQKYLYVLSLLLLRPIFDVERR